MGRIGFVILNHFEDYRFVLTHPLVRSHGMEVRVIQGRLALWRAPNSSLLGIRRTDLSYGTSYTFGYSNRSSDLRIIATPDAAHIGLFRPGVCTPCFI
jgi:hypothetical protein